MKISFCRIARRQSAHLSIREQTPADERRFSDDTHLPERDEQAIFLPSYKIARGEVPPFRQLIETDTVDAHS